MIRSTLIYPLFLGDKSMKEKHQHLSITESFWFCTYFFFLLYRRCTLHFYSVLCVLSAPGLQRELFAVSFEEFWLCRKEESVRTRDSDSPESCSTVATFPTSLGPRTVTALLETGDSAVCKVSPPI